MAPVCARIGIAFGKDEQRNHMAEKRYESDLTGKEKRHLEWEKDQGYDMEAEDRTYLDLL